MNKFTKRLTEFFNKENITYYFDFVAEDEGDDRGCDELTVPAALSDLPGVIVRIIVNDTGKCSFMVKLGTAKDVYDIFRLYKILNRLNEKYSFVSFSVNDNRSVLMNLNFIMSRKMQFDIIDEYFHAVISISSDASKEILPLLWGKILIDEEDHEENQEEDFEPFFVDEESFIDGEENMDSNDSDEETVDELEYSDEIQFEDLFQDEEFIDDSDDSDDSDEDEVFAS